MKAHLKWLALCTLFFSGMTQAATTTFFSNSQPYALDQSGQTFNALTSEGYVFTYAQDKLFTGGGPAPIGRNNVVAWPNGLHAQAVTIAPFEKAHVTITRVDGNPFDILAFSITIYSNTAAGGANFEVVPTLQGVDLYADPVYFEAAGPWGARYTYSRTGTVGPSGVIPNSQNTSPLTGADSYKISLFSDFALTGATITTAAQGPTVALNFNNGWSLVGNGSDAPINVSTTFSDTNSFTSVWKWVLAQNAWALHAPSLAAQGGTVLADYLASKGYQSLTTIAGGEGFWVNAMQVGSVNLTNGNAISVAALGPTLTPGWNLVSVGETATPKQFCDSQSGGVTTLWAWDASVIAWYFYAPSLDASGDLSSYITSKGYLDLTAAGKTLGPGVGFWVNK